MAKGGGDDELRREDQLAELFSLEGWGIFLDLARDMISSARRDLILGEIPELRRAERRGAFMAVRDLLTRTYQNADSEVPEGIRRLFE